MSTPSLLRSLQAADTSLFHSALGSVSPVGLRLELTAVLDPDSSSLAEYVAALGALLHERHHWLQQVGTTAGVFHTLMLEVQAAVATRVVSEGITPDDLPLVSSRFRAESDVVGWQRFEATRRLFYGCRTGDFSVLLKAGFAPEFVHLSGFVRELLESLVAGRDEDGTGRFSWWDEVLAEPAPKLPSGLRHGSVGVGARHLMECAARQSEMFRIVDMEMRGGATGHDVTGLFAGDYGVVRDLFYDTVERQATDATEIALAFACDVALNGVHPPLAPAAGGFVDQTWPPGVLFVVIARLLATFPFDDHDRVSVFEPEDVRELLDALWAAVEPRYPLSNADLTSAMGRVLHGLDPEAVAADTFVVEPGGLPRPTRPGSRIRYGLAQSAEAFRLRGDQPELFVLPACRYVEDRKDFHGAFDRIQPPIVAYGTSGLAPTRDLYGWLEFFLASAVTHEIVRGAMVCDVPRLAERLVPYLRSYGGDEHGRAVVEAAIFNAVGAPLGTPLWDAVRARDQRIRG